MFHMHPRAGQPAQPEDLVDVDALLKAYDDIVPDVENPAQKVTFGTSGHRGSALDGAFNEAHILAITQAICLYRRRHGIDGPLFLGIDTHALSESASTGSSTGSSTGPSASEGRRARGRHSSAVTGRCGAPTRTGSS